jgi:putative transposase
VRDGAKVATPAGRGIWPDELLKRLDRIFTDNPIYGSRRLQVALLREGISAGRRHVWRLMRKLGLWAVRLKRNTSKRHPEHKDWATRRVLSWRLSNTLTAEFCVEAQSEALARFGKPDIFNTDQSLPLRKRGARNPTKLGLRWITPKLCTAWT